MSFVHSVPAGWHSAGFGIPIMFPAPSYVGHCSLDIHVRVLAKEAWLIQEFTINRDLAMSKGCWIRDGHECPSYIYTGGSDSAHFDTYTSRTLFRITSENLRVQPTETSIQ